MKSKPYWVPFLVFLIFTELARFFPKEAHLLYLTKTLVVLILLIWWREVYQELRARAKTREVFLAVISGLLVFVIWIGGERFFPQTGTPQGFSPYTFGLETLNAHLLAFVRLLGAALVVPLMEELFWRSFLMRYLIHKEFWKIPLGTYTHFSFWTVALLFSLEHFRIVPGFLAGLVYGGLLCLTKNLRVSIYSHATTNLALGIYVLSTQTWSFW